LAPVFSYFGLSSRALMSFRPLIMLLIFSPIFLDLLL
jgi:hypothetical protein